MHTSYSINNNKTEMVSVEEQITTSPPTLLGGRDARIQVKAKKQKAERRVKNKQTMAWPTEPR
jgi:hypothetical protein